MVLKFNVNKSTIVFKTALKKLFDDFPEIKDSSLLLHFFLKNLKLIKEVLKKTVVNLNKIFFKFTSVF